MLLSDDNGCMCSILPKEARPCLACSGRSKSKAGRCKTKNCFVKLFSDEAEEKDGYCTKCYYRKYPEWQ